MSEHLELKRKGSIANYSYFLKKKNVNNETKNNPQVASSECCSEERYKHMLLWQYCSFLLLFFFNFLCHFIFFSLSSKIRTYKDSRISGNYKARAKLCGQLPQSRCWIRLPLFLMGFSTRLASPPYNVFHKRAASINEPPGKPHAKF